MQLSPLPNNVHKWLSRLNYLVLFLTFSNFWRFILGPHPHPTLLYIWLFLWILLNTLLVYANSVDICKSKVKARISTFIFLLIMLAIWLSMR